MRRTLTIHINNPILESSIQERYFSHRSPQNSSVWVVWRYPRRHSTTYLAGLQNSPWGCWVRIKAVLVCRVSIWSWWQHTSHSLPGSGPQSCSLNEMEVWLGDCYAKACNAYGFVCGVRNGCSMDLLRSVELQIFTSQWTKTFMATTIKTPYLAGCNLQVGLYGSYRI
jgi:hypothetical protein